MTGAEAARGGKRWNLKMKKDSQKTKHPDETAHASDGGGTTYEVHILVWDEGPT